MQGLIRYLKSSLKRISNQNPVNFCLIKRSKGDVMPVRQRPATRDDLTRYIEPDRFELPCTTNQLQVANVQPRVSMHAADAWADGVEPKLVHTVT